MSAHSSAAGRLALYRSSEAWQRESARESAQRQREKAERLLRAADLKDRGAQGEEHTADVLSALPADQWTVLHDVRVGQDGSLPMLTMWSLAPAGVFVIDSKNWSGQITIREEVLRQNGYKREPAVAGAAEAAWAVAQLTNVVRPDLVRPVLCFVRDEEVAGWARDVMVCSTRNLLKLLQSRPAALSPTQVRDASIQLGAQLSAARSVPAPRSVRIASRRPRRLPTSRPVRSRSSRRSSNRKQGPSWLPLLVAVALLGVLVFAPQVVTGFGEFVAGLLVSQVE